MPSSRANTSAALPTVSAGPDAMKLLSEFKQLLNSHIAAHPDCRKSAPQMQKYMHNQFKFFGLQSPARRLIQAGFIKSHHGELEDRDTLLQFVPLLWQQEEREFQYFGLDLMKAFRNSILGTSLDHFQEAVSCVEQLVTSKSWWDTVDALSYPGRSSAALCPLRPRHEATDSVHVHVLDHAIIGSLGTRLSHRKESLINCPYMTCYDTNLITVFVSVYG